MTLGFLYDPERNNCIARYTTDLEVFDCCRDGRKIGNLQGTTIYGRDGTELGKLGALGPGRLPTAFRTLLAE